MAKSNAERQADYRRRRREEREAARRAERAAELAGVAARFEAAFRELEAERDALKRDNEALTAALAKLARPCTAHARSAGFIGSCPACGLS